MSNTGKVWAVGAMNSRRFLRERSNLFFAFVFPLALILIIGLQFGGDAAPRLGVVDPGGDIAGIVSEQLAAAQLDITIVRSDDAGSLVERVESTDLDAAIVFPPDLDDTIARGDEATIGFTTANTTAGQQLATLVDDILARALAVPTVEQLAVERGADPAQAAAAAARLEPTLARIEVATVTTGDRLFPSDIEGYDVAAPSTLVLFVFVNGLAGSYALIQSRQLGISSRMMSTPTSVRSIIFGEALGRLSIGLIQGGYILLATLVVFGVNWGDPLGATIILVMVAAVSAGASMCFGVLFSNPEQASGIGVVVALGFGALGGAMMPIELFSDTLETIARFTPHFWAIDAFAELVRHDASITDIGTQLGVLGLFAVGFLLFAAWRMRIVLTRPGRA
ncbi:MAG: ABC transporter permease [Acidimicrobiia bacterium]|nr:ABC transporter permease [Acidimicrobiia bacterium]